MRHRIGRKYKINSRSKFISEAIVSSKTIDELKMKLDILGVNYDRKSDINFLSFIFSYFKNTKPGTILCTGYSKPSTEYILFFNDVFLPYANENIDKILDFDHAIKMLSGRICSNKVALPSWKLCLMYLYFKKHLKDLTLKK